MREIPVVQSVNPNYNRILSVGDSLWLIPTMNEKVLQLSVQSQEVTYHGMPIERIKQNAEMTGFYSMFASCNIENIIYIAAPTSNKIILFDTVTGEVDSKEIKTENTGFWHMIYDGKDIWLIPFIGKAIVRWNPLTETTVELKEYPEGFEFLENDKDYFINIVDCGTYLLAFPKCANMIVKINKENETMEKWEMDLPYKEGERKNSNYSWGSNYYFAKKIDDKVYAMTAYDNSLLEISIGERSFRRIEFGIPAENHEEILKRYFMPINAETVEKFYIRENSFRRVGDFIKFLQNDKVGYLRKEQELFLKDMSNNDGYAGKQILKYVIGK